MPSKFRSQGLLALLLGAANQVKAQTVVGVGTISCGEWLKLRPCRRGAGERIAIPCTTIGAYSRKQGDFSPSSFVVRAE